VSEMQNPRRVLRSIGAVVAGSLANIILTIGTDAILHVAGVFPPLGQPTGDRPLLLATAYRIIYGILGCYIMARLAPNRPMLHALIGGLVGFAACVAGAVVTWNGGPAFGPHWYPLALIATAIPCGWVGGNLRMRQLSGRSSA
jgi:hypothetical protein